MRIPKEIDSIATRLRSGQRVKRITVRRLLELFDAERRGAQKVQEIKSVLDDLNLETDPDFEHAWIDSTIKIRLKGTSLHDNDLELAGALDSSDVESLQFDSQQNGAQASSGSLSREDLEPEARRDGLSELDIEAEETEDVADARPITEPFDPRAIRIETKQLSLDVLISRMQEQ